MSIYRLLTIYELDTKISNFRNLTLLTLKMTSGQVMLKMALLNSLCSKTPIWFPRWYLYPF